MEARRAAMDRRVLGGVFWRILIIAEERDVGGELAF